MDHSTEEEEPTLTFRIENDEANRPRLDQLGRRNLHKFSLPTFFAAAFIPAGIPFEKIPGEFWTLDSDADGYTVAQVACPCGNSPIIAAADLGLCTCERGYAFTGSEVYVINSQKVSREPAVPQDIN